MGRWGDGWDVALLGVGERCIVYMFGFWERLLSCRASSHVHTMIIPEGTCTHTHTHIHAKPPSEHLSSLALTSDHLIVCTYVAMPSLIRYPHGCLIGLLYSMAHPPWLA